MLWSRKFLVVLIAPAATALLVALALRIWASTYTWALIVEGLATLFAVIWPAGIMSSRISQRIAQLTHYSAVLTTTHTPPPLIPQRGDLIGRLETNLVRMAKVLKTRLRDTQEEKGKLEAVLSGMREGVLVIDHVGVVLLSNDRAERIFSAPQHGSLVGMPLIRISRDPDLHALAQEMIRNPQEEKFTREISLITDKGAETLQVTASPIATPRSTPDLFILVFHDVTELKQLEATRRDFVANVSHEIRTPLTAIQGYAETLRDGALLDPALAEKFLGVIERHSERLGRLTEDLLTLSDLELGKTPLTCTEVPVTEIINTVLEVVREKAKRQDVSITSEIPPHLPTLYANADRLEQVMVNLCDNAVKYTPAGGKVTVRAQEVPAPDSHPPTAVPLPETCTQWVQITVSDTGVGIPSRDLPRITERFYRVDKARSRELGGTGLGLAIVKHIVHMHGGVLAIHSEVNTGTNVSVTLPALEVIDIE